MRSPSLGVTAGVPRVTVLYSTHPGWLSTRRSQRALCGSPFGDGERVPSPYLDFPEGLWGFGGSALGWGLHFGGGTLGLGRLAPSPRPPLIADALHPGRGTQDQGGRWLEAHAAPEPPYPAWCLNGVIQRRVRLPVHPASGFEARAGPVGSGRPPGVTELRPQACWLEGGYTSPVAGSAGCPAPGQSGPHGGLDLLQTPLVVSPPHNEQLSGSLGKRA